MRKYLAGAILVLVLGAFLPAQSGVTVKSGGPVMLDGKCEKGEWGDAMEVNTGGGARLQIKTFNRFVYIAIVFPASRSGFTDLYLALPDGSIYDLHASAKLGERRLQQRKWPEWRDWWNNEGWVANVSRVDSFENRTFLPTNCREYQIDRDGFPGKEWRMAIQMSIELPPGRDYAVVKYPASEIDSNPEKWLRVRFED